MIFKNYQNLTLLWEEILEIPLSFDAAFKILPTKGKIAWEYNPLRNLRLDLDMFEYGGKLHTRQEFYSDYNRSDKDTGKLPAGVLYYLKGELVDFITDQLSFNLKNPVSLIPSYSYDGSVDLILNDGKNQPRLINTRFSTTGLNTYEVINRKGDNDTNIYDMGSLFDIDTSLYKKTNKIPKVIFNGLLAGGDLKVGNYHFYFKYADADGNETDFVAESGLVSIFKGMSSPISMSTGQRDENSLKSVSFTIKNIDSGYLYLHVYYTRSSAELNQNMVTKAVKINLKFLVNTNGISNIYITGLEESTDIPISDINLQYNVVQSAKSQTICLNMLFMANVQKANIPYEELLDLSLRFLPYLHTEKYPLSIDENYSIHSNSKGYYDSKFIYNFTGYWNKDLYRLGIVYIMKDNTLSPVFNIRGREKVKEFTNYAQYDEVNSEAYTKIPVYSEESGIKERVYINYDEASHMIIKSGNNATPGNGLFENSKGVVSLDSTVDTDTILGFDIRADLDTIKELQKYVKGFFFVRLRRMPMTLCQGITIGIENNSKLPAIPTTHGITNIDYENTYSETRDKNPDEIHFVMEGFLGRYTYKLKQKSSGFWKKFGIAFAVAAVVAAGIVGSVILPGAGTAIATGGVMALIGTVTAASATVLVPVAIGAAAIVGTTAIVAGAQSIALKAQQSRYSDKAAEPWKGRYAPITPGYERQETEDSRRLDADFKQRVILLDQADCSISGLLVPDYTVNPARYNELFNGDEFVVEYTTSQALTNFTNCGYFLNKNRHFYVSGYLDWDNTNRRNYVQLLTVPDGISAVGIDLQIFRSKAGDPFLATKFEQTRMTFKDDTVNTNSDLIRGMYGPYVAMTGFLGSAVTTLNIMVPGYDESRLQNYIAMRISDHSEYSAISDRFDIFDLPLKKVNLVQSTEAPFHFETVCYRGDCYICQFTLRINRNLNDENAPYNETIVDPKTWKLFDINDPEKLAKINTGDLNAVELGMWVTFRVRSNYNLNIRTIDDSWIEERAECGHARSYFPLEPMSTDGSYKIPEAQVYNLGFSKSLSERYNFEVPDVPYIKNWFGTRIMYSDINITDGYKNGFRTFKGTAYRDYTREYGSITKIVELQGNLIVVFEHGVGFLEVNEKAVAAQSLSGNAYITTNNVLPEKLTILSDAIGSLWADSILKVPIKLGSASSVVFGVDTVAKKIWMCDGREVTCISDFKVLEFLNNNITLGERDLTPILGVRNVKTFYNAYKQDVMFTFYDYLNGFEDKAWNLCYNLTLNKFVTFYSWLPAYMNSIDNIPFSFDRDVLKALGKLGISKEGNDFSDGIVLSTNIIPNSLSERYIGKLSLANRVLPFSDNEESSPVKYKINYEIVRDNYRNDLLFDTEVITEETANEAEGRFIGDTWLVFNKLPGKARTFNDFNNDGKINTSTTGGEQNRVDSYKGSIVYIEGLGEGDRVKPANISSELYYRNLENHVYADWTENSNIPEYYTTEGKTLYEIDYTKPAWPHKKLTETEEEYQNKLSTIFANNIKQGYPIFKDRSGRKVMLPEGERINADQLIRLVNIRASIQVGFAKKAETLFEVYKTTKDNATETNPEKNDDVITYYDCGYYESSVALTTSWNLQFLTSDFWKHGQAGLIDIADDIKPTVWYGKQHPFEFECVVVNDPSVHKIFLNLELVSNKAQPESFHFEIIGEAYDFAKDKATMYFRQEARKALFQYNGCNISYDRNFVKILPRLAAKSAELVHNYYERLDKLEEIKDTYVGDAGDQANYPTAYDWWAKLTPNVDYRHLSGAEIVYYKNRNEYRIWQHLPAINIDNLPQDLASSIIRGNCLYLEDRWKVSINPLLICYKNEYIRKSGVNGVLCLPANSTWPNALGADLKTKTETKLPPITLKNTSLPRAIKLAGRVDFPDEIKGEGKDNSLYGLYSWEGNCPVDNTNWLSDPDIYKTMFGTALNRKETDLRDKFMKVRIRYSGEDLAVIDFLNTVYTISYA